MANLEDWIDSSIPKFQRISESIPPIVKSLLNESKIDYLSVTSRTKTKESINEKIKRKSYRRPKQQLTDISGIRIILFIESDIERVEKILSKAFRVDKKNSGSRQAQLSSNEVGYRSSHIVCDIGPQRAKLPESIGLEWLKFEFQIRTVLQHAWAELAHDRSYKFQGTLPDEIQRKLFLYAGLLEIADAGFSDIASEIDAYHKNVLRKYKQGNLDVNLNSISIQEFLINWAEKNNLEIEIPSDSSEYKNIISELKGFGIESIDDLSEIIPANFGDVARSINYKTNTYGLIRDWLIIKDFDLIYKKIEHDWILYIEDESELDIYKKICSDEEFKKILDSSIIANDNDVDFTDE